MCSTVGAAAVKGRDQGATASTNHPVMHRTVGAAAVRAHAEASQPVPYSTEGARAALAARLGSPNPQHTSTPSRRRAGNVQNCNAFNYSIFSACLKRGSTQKQSALFSRKISGVFAKQTATDNSAAHELTDPLQAHNAILRGILRAVMRIPRQKKCRTLTGLNQIMRTYKIASTVTQPMGTRELPARDRHDAR